MKQLLSIFIGLSICATALIAKSATADDPVQTWNQVEQQRQQSSEAREAKEKNAQLKAVRAERIQEAFQLAAAETGEPASAFAYKCMLSGRPTCDFAEAVPFDYYRFIALQSRTKICKYDSLGTYTNHAPAFMGFFGDHDVEATGSIICHNR